MEVASWNIEKNGYTSARHKQAKVDHFISNCVDKNVGIIFLCELHGALKTDYISFLQSAYRNYHVQLVSGGRSNNYIILYSKRWMVTFIGMRHLSQIKRYLAIFRWNGTAIGLGHFKSGGRDRTIKQIQSSATFLDKKYGHNWMITGDINLDYQRRGELFKPTSPGDLSVPADTQFCSYWGYAPTQKQGNTLDWALYGKNTKLYKWEPMRSWRPELFDMKGPDHKPIAYRIGGFYS